MSVQNPDDYSEDIREQMKSKEHSNVEKFTAGWGCKKISPASNTSLFNPSSRSGQTWGWAEPDLPAGQPPKAKGYNGMVLALCDGLSHWMSMKYF